MNHHRFLSLGGWWFKSEFKYICFFPPCFAGLIIWTIASVIDIKSFSNWKAFLNQAHSHFMREIKTELLVIVIGVASFRVIRDLCDAISRLNFRKKLKKCLRRAYRVGQVMVSFLVTETETHENHCFMFLKWCYAPNGAIVEVEARFMNRLFIFPISSKPGWWVNRKEKSVLKNVSVQFIVTSPVQNKTSASRLPRKSWQLHF